ncbi:MAG: DNA repair protein RadA, partial [Candidatus Dormibacteraeota bacterium]|nr:DNA repair protein RadA [Candidatus Dormibacteraeota bacterium]
MPVTAPRTARPRFVCDACGAESPKWTGRCASCGGWNSLQETVAVGGRSERGAVAAQQLRLSVLPAAAASRLSSGHGEVDRVLGGGFVPGSVVLLGGDPGVGKSTLALQVAASCGAGRPALYCSGEESADQVAMRARRLGCKPETLGLVVETDLDAVLGAIEAADAPLTVVDSVQTLVDSQAAGSAGSPAQVRNAISRLVGVAKRAGVTVMVIGHVTKDGAIAGPRTLEHMVDVVLYLEGERLGEQRLLRGVKNRFGSTGEVGLLTMETDGMHPALAPGRALVGGESLSIPGNVLTVSCEGVRPMLVEVQALALQTAFGMPRRTASGFDVNRLYLLLGVLEKRGRKVLSKTDVFLNVVGGVEVDDPGCDLAVALAVAAAASNRQAASACAVLGELGLGGEVRRVPRLAARLREAATLGVERAVVPRGGAADAPGSLHCTEVATLAEA